MWPFKKKESETRQEHPAVAFFMMHEKNWDWFLRKCEKYDYIKIKDGRAVGYTLANLPELQPEIKEDDFQEMRRRLFNQGDGILIPELCVRPTFY